jgi:hypothetical protein
MKGTEIFRRQFANARIYKAVVVNEGRFKRLNKILNRFIHLPIEPARTPSGIVRFSMGNARIEEYGVSVGKDINYGDFAYITFGILSKDDYKFYFIDESEDALISKSLEELVKGRIEIEITTSNAGTFVGKIKAIQEGSDIRFEIVKKPLWRFWR